MRSSVTHLTEEEIEWVLTTWEGPGNLTDARRIGLGAVFVVLSSDKQADFACEL